MRCSPPGQQLYDSANGQAGLTGGFLDLGSDTLGNFNLSGQSHPNSIILHGATVATATQDALDTVGFALGIVGTPAVRVSLAKIDAGQMAAG